jgi:putative oxidoreductase
MHAYGPDNTLPAFGPAALRVGLGAIFIAHGAQKLFGIWGGGGLSGTAAGFDQLGLQPSYALAVAAGIAEFAGGILLVLGALTVPAAVVLTLTMLVAVWKVHLANGFFLNWTMTPGQGHGYEYNLAVIAGLLCLMLTGPGAFSIDGRRAESAAAEAAGRARLRGKV